MIRLSEQGSPTTTRCRASRVSAVLLAVAMVASGCRGDVTVGAPDDDADGIELLAGVGIAVFGAPEDSSPVLEPAEPVSPVRLLEWQAHNLAAARWGMTAEQLDDAVPGGSVGELTWTTSQLIVSWAEHADTPAAAWARELLSGPEDLPEEVSLQDAPVFSDLVLLLFTSDVATAGASLPDPQAAPGSNVDAATRVVAANAGDIAEAAHPVAAGVDLGGACEAAVGFVANVRAAITNALHRLTVDPPAVNTGFGLFDTIVNTLAKGATGVLNATVDGVRILVDGVFAATVDQVLSFVARIAGVVGTLAKVRNLVVPWTVNVTEREPKVNQVAVRPAERGPPGTITARVSTSFDSWPAGIERCARSVGEPLPDLRPSGNPVTWQWDVQGTSVRNGIVLGEMDHDLTEGKLDEDGTARLHYHAGVEDPPKDGATQEWGVVYVQARIQRDDVTELQEMFHTLVTDALTGALPLASVPFVRELVSDAARGLLDEITSDVARALEQVRTYGPGGMVVIIFHLPGEDDTAPPGGTGSLGSVPAGCPGRLPGHGTKRGWQHFLDHAPRFPSGVIGCPYSDALESISILGLFNFPTVETDVPGQLLMVGLQDPPFILRTGWERVDVVGAELAWLHQHTEHVPEEGHSVTSTNLLATVGDRSLYLDLYPPAGGPEHVRVAEYLLALD